MPTAHVSPALDQVLAGLNPPQLEAVLHEEGPLLTFAGAGSGKTRVLTTRIARLVATGKAWPDRLLAVTFTNKAAKEMRGRVEMLVGEPAQTMWVGTFHSTAVKILRREADRLGLHRSFVIFDEDDTRAALRRVLEIHGLDQKRYPPATLSHLISKAKNDLIEPDGYPSESYQDEIVRRCYRTYQEILQTSQALDFDDLILRLVLLFREDADALATWQDRFRHVLVDEYQDTNRAQYVLVNLLAREHRNLAVVGDDDQSVYGWRGADVRNILDFKKDYPEAHVVNLEQNYRSTQPILDVAHAVISRNVDRAPKRLWTARTGGDRVVALQPYNEVEEAEYVADEIGRLKRSEGRDFGDFAVLYRTNAQSRAFEDVLNRRRIPYRLVGGVKFWERREIRDVVAYLRFLSNPADGVSFGRIVNVPRRKVGPVTVEALTSFAHEAGLDLIETMDRIGDVPGVPRQALGAVEQFARQLKSLRALIGAVGPGELADQVVEVMGLRDYYDDGTPQGEARLENLGELRGLAEEVGGNDPSNALETFLTEIALVSDVDGYDDQGPGVTLITLHMVKGLEFPVVFLVGLEEGLLPHQRSLDDPKAEAEERRLCYVGMTRAKDRLYLSCAFRRHVHGHTSAGLPSRFLSEIPRPLLAAPIKGMAPVPPPRSGTHRDRLMERQSQPAPAAPPVQRYAAQERVQHPTFGNGVIIKSTLTRTDEELMVQFDTAGLKILSGMLAPLTKL
ncbi:MAG TPA: UvrD-helicase domain-containing protein [Candidatus Dormibacteraeota bacterium]|nr:UvrD-helicase domain-containing protein [Candidatus Dormibacteraeota bacterium]